VRPADRLGSGQSADLVVPNVDAEGLQPLDDFGIPAVPALPQSGKTLIEGGILPIQKIAQHVEFRVAVPRADFQAGNHFDSELPARCHGFGDGRRDVVIGDREGADTGLVRECDDFAWRQAPVRVGGVQVKIEATHTGLP